MNTIYPIAYCVVNLNNKYLGTCERLIDAVGLAQEKGYLYPDRINIYAFYENDIKELVLKEYYSVLKLDNANFTRRYRWLDRNALNSVERKIYKLRDLKKKKCWSCGTILCFKDFCLTNQKISQENAVKLWDSPYVELYCCNCFKRVKRKLQEEKKKKILNRYREIQITALNSKDKKMLKILEEEICKPIPPVAKVDHKYHTRNAGFISKEGCITGFSLYYYLFTNLPESLKAFSNIEYLDLCGNLLTTLPEWIESFKSLKYLNLMANELKELPESIYSLNSLEILDLSGNKLTNIPNSLILLPSLKFLYLWANEFKSNPPILNELREKGIYIAI